MHRSSAASARRAAGERRSRWLALAVATGSLLFLSACSRDLPPNIVLVSVDTLRADALGAYGGPLPTPAFDRLAQEGALFERAFAPAPATASSHATLFTGQEPQRHGVLRNGESLPDAANALAEVFRANGWRTGAFVSSFVLDPRFGWSQGFDHYDADLPEGGATMGKDRAYPGAFWGAERFAGFDRRATGTTDAARRWIEASDEPFFAFVHYFDPHAPYVPPLVFQERAAAAVVPLEGRSAKGLGANKLETLIRRYLGEVLYTDDALAALLDLVDGRSGRSTLVVVTADHGEGLGQHDWMEHALHLYEEQLHVPLLLHWPGTIPAGHRIATPVALADVAPTILALVGLPPVPAMDGRSLADAVRGGPEPPALPIFGVRRLVGEAAKLGQSVKFSVRDGSWKFIWNSGHAHELYDLATDPEERRNVIAEHPDVAAKLLAKIEARIAAMPTADDAAPLSDETRDALRALGYVE
jgi:arylsulfatase A-like enzyme